MANPDSEWDAKARQDEDEDERIDPEDIDDPGSSVQSRKTGLVEHGTDSPDDLELAELIDEAVEPDLDIAKWPPP